MLCKLGNGYIFRLPSIMIFLFVAVIKIKSEKIKNPFIIFTFFSLLFMICIYAKSFELIIFLSSIFTLILSFQLKKVILPVVVVMTAIVFVRQGIHLFAYNFLCDNKKPDGNIEFVENQTYVIDEFVIRHPLNWQFPKNWKIAPGFGTTNERLLKNQIQKLGY